MKISRRGSIPIVEDGPGARYGVGVFVPALLAAGLFLIIWPKAEGQWRFDLAALVFVAATVALAVLRAPRISEFDLTQRRLDLTIGWPPLFGRRESIPFSTIREVRVWNPIRLSEDLGRARPALILSGGRRVFLSTYNRSPRYCREVVDQVRQFLGLEGPK